MKTQRVAIALVTLSLVAGCATAPPRAVRSEFEDIPVPKGLTYLDDQSTIIESPSVKAARLLYRGRIEPASLANALRATLEANNWRHVSTAATAHQPTTQVYEKGGNSLQVRVWEGMLYTYVEYTASRALQPPGNKAQQQ